MDAKGYFDVRDIVPGDYMLMVSDGTSSSRWMSVTPQLTVDQDVLGLELRAEPGARVEGRVVRDVGVTRPLDSARVRVGFRKRVDSGPAATAMRIGGFHVQADGTFSAESPGGPTSVEIMDLPPNWVVKSIRLDNVEIGSDAIDFGAGARRRIEIVLTDRVSTVMGSVHDRNGRPLSNYSVVIFPDDSRLWTPESRFVREVRSGQGGQFRVEGLPSSEYMAVALESLPFIAWMDPQVLESLRPSAAQFRLGEGDQRTLTLRESPQPERLGPSLIAR